MEECKHGKHDDRKIHPLEPLLIERYPSTRHPPHRPRRHLCLVSEVLIQMRLYPHNGGGLGGLLGGRSRLASVVSGLCVGSSDLVLSSLLLVWLDNVSGLPDPKEDRSRTFFSASLISFHLAPRSLPTSPKLALGFSSLIRSL